MRKISEIDANSMRLISVNLNVTVKNMYMSNETVMDKLHEVVNCNIINKVN